MSKTVKDKNASSARSKTAKDKTRDKIVTRALGPDVVNDKGQQIPFSRRGWEFPGRDDDDGDKTRTSPRASRPAKPGLPMPLTIDEMDYVIVDNGAANPGELAIGRVHNVDDELVKVHWHALKDASVPTPKQVWWPTWVGPDGTLRTSDLPMRGRTTETDEVNSSNRDGRLPVRGAGLLGEDTNNGVRHRLQSTLTHDRMSSDFYL